MVTSEELKAHHSALNIQNKDHLQSSFFSQENQLRFCSQVTTSIPNSVYLSLVWVVEQTEA